MLTQYKERNDEHVNVCHFSSNKIITYDTLTTILDNLMDNLHVKPF